MSESTILTKAFANDKDFALEANSKLLLIRFSNAARRLSEKPYKTFNLLDALFAFAVNELRRVSCFSVLTCVNALLMFT